MNVANSINPSISSTGWKAGIDLSFESGPDKTVVRRTHYGPLHIQRPFYPEGSLAHVYLLHPPGGVVSKDELFISASVKSDAEALVTTPGATKFYRCPEHMAQVKQELNVADGSLEWFPQENIFFNQSCVSVSTSIQLRKHSAFAGWDIHCFGRSIGNEPFTQGRVSTSLTLSVDNNIVFFDRLLVTNDHPLSDSTTFRDCTVIGMLLINNMANESIALARDRLHHSQEFSVTCCDSLLVVRYLGNSAQKAKQGFSGVWSELRRQLNGRTACVPRIWAT